MAVTNWTDPTLSTYTEVKPQHINELRAAVRAEQARRSRALTNFGVNVDTNVEVYAQAVKDLYNAIASLKTFSWNYSFSAFNTDTNILGNHVADLRNKINDAEDDCLCNCNYCTCNCNYCTCNCNYCTCNCNYCTCNCNYCTCNCNYSCTCNCNYVDSS